MAFSRGRRGVWANERARVVLRGAAGGVLAALARAAAELGPERTTTSWSLDPCGGGALRGRLWQASAELLGAELHRETVRWTDRAALLRARFGLTPRQSEVAALIGLGRTSDAIARELGVREGTVRAIRTQVYERLGLTGRVALSAWLPRW